MITQELEDLALQHEDGLRAAIAGLSFPDFLSYVKILEPPPGMGVIQFETWPHLMELVDLLLSHRLVSILKARQVGVSWLLAAYALWTALYHKGAQVMMISRGEREAGDLLDKAKFIHKGLPALLKRKTGVESQSEYSFPQMLSIIRTLPSTEHAGHGYTSTLVIQDEADYHENIDLNYMAIKPTIDAGGQLIMASTSNKSRMTSLFKQIYRQSPDNGYRRLFLPWHVRPGRDEAWYQATRSNVPETAELSPALYMEQEYPSTENEALAPSRALAFFDQDALGGMVGDCKEPVEMRLGGLVRLWRKPVVAGKYVAFGDCAWGEKGSYSCLGIADWQTGEQVAEIYGRPTLDEMALRVVELCKEYNRAYVGIEDNGEGRNVVKKMRELGYSDRMYCRTPEHPDKEYRSWQTDSSTRPVMLGELEEAVRMRRIVPRCRDALGELGSFIRDERGRPGPAQGAYADHVMMWAGLWQMRKYASFSTGGRGALQPYTW